MTPSPDERFAVLGQVVERAAVMEIALRMAFCALVGSRYAAAIAGSQETHWLIENCDAVARRHDELPAGQRDAIRAALQECRQANRDRNRLVHEAWGTGVSGAPSVLQSVCHGYRMAGRDWTIAQIREAAEAISRAQLALLAAIEDAFAPGSLEAAGQLLASDAAKRDGEQNHG
ncbi:MAG TPA: hypothetical protein VMB74_10670 [Streptosporangiaceae bacterium]|nr:hypothetical protein [Streptosporangiaceae bacterium]